MSLTGTIVFLFLICIVGDVLIAKEIYAGIWSGLVRGDGTSIDVLCAKWVEACRARRQALR